MRLELGTLPFHGFELAIYADNGAGYPGSLLVRSGSINLGFVGGEYVWDFDDLSVPAGDHWLVLEGEGVGAQAGRGSTPLSDVLVLNEGGIQDPFLPGAIGSSNPSDNISLWVDYCFTAPTPTPTNTFTATRTPTLTATATATGTLPTATWTSTGTLTPTLVPCDTNASAGVSQAINHVLFLETAARKVTLPTCNLTAMKFAVEPMPPFDGFELAIYADNGSGYPGNLLVRSGSINFVPGGAEYDWDFDDLSILAGDYWLALEGEGFGVQVGHASGPAMDTLILDTGGIQAPFLPGALPSSNTLDNLSLWVDYCFDP
jgi:hypothetical protein